MINYIVEYDENLSDVLKSLDDCMNSLRKHHKAQDGKIPFLLNLKLSLLYKIAWHMRLSIAKWADRHAKRSIETDTVMIRDIDWSDMTPSEVHAAIKLAEEKMLRESEGISF